MPYILLPILAVFAFLFEKPVHQTKLYKILLWFSILAAVGIVGFRGEGIGTDYWQYRGYFSEWVSKIEPGFNILSAIFRSLGANFIVFSAIYFIITLYFKIWVFKKMSLSAAISLMISFGFWLLVYDLNGIRQGLSVAFLGVAVYHTYKKNLYRYLLFVVLAISFHYSSLVFLPFYFLVNIKIDKVGMFIFVAFIFLFNLFDLSKYMFAFFMDSSASDSYFQSKTSAYSNIEEYNANALFSFGVIHRLIIFLLTLFTVERISADERLKRIFLIAAFLNFSTYLMLSSIELIATRGSLGFRYVECIYFSYLPFLFKNRFLQYLAGFIILAYVILQVYLTISVPDGNLVPYRTIFG